jgi:hypothetical protein
VAQVVKAQLPQAGVGEGLLVAAPQGRVVEERADVSGEDEVVVGRTPAALRQPRQRAGNVRGERDGARLAVFRRRQVAIAVAAVDADDRAGEVDVALAQGVARPCAAL